MKVKRFFLFETYLNSVSDLVISDPCYKSNNGCNYTLHDFLPGKYYIVLDTEESPMNSIYYINSAVYLVHEKYISILNDCENVCDLVTKVCVDSGTLGIFSAVGFNKTHNESYIDRKWYDDLKYSAKYRFQDELESKLNLIYDKKSDGYIFAAHDDGNKKIQAKKINDKIVFLGISLNDKLNNNPDEYYYSTFLEDFTPVNELTSDDLIIREVIHYNEGVELCGNNICENTDIDISVFENFLKIKKIVIERDYKTRLPLKIEICYE